MRSLVLETFLTMDILDLETCMTVLDLETFSMNTLELETFSMADILDSKTFPYGYIVFRNGFSYWVF